MWCRQSAADAHLKVKDRVPTRRPDPPITDEKRRDQSAGEREPGRDQHHCAERGDEGLVYGALDMRLRTCLNTLRDLRRPEITCSDDRAPIRMRSRFGVNLTSKSV
jgi:hypothetical protein